MTQADMGRDAYGRDAYGRDRFEYDRDPAYLGEPVGEAMSGAVIWGIVIVAALFLAIFWIGPMVVQPTVP